MAAKVRTSLSPIRAYLQYVMGATDRLYAVVDAARDKELAFAARERFGLKLHTLFEGNLAKYLDHVAPHLIPLERDSEYLELWAEHLGRSAGILLLTDAPTDVLRAHLRQIFVVQDEEGEEFSFRYYDPRVLRVYLPTCTAEEARDFFGLIRRILVESDQPGVMLSCGPEGSGVKVTARALRAPEEIVGSGGVLP
jgi:hypothetical protein